MRLQDLERIEGKRKKVQADLPGVRSSGYVKSMSPEEKKAAFASLYAAVDGEESPLTAEQREFQEKVEAQKKGKSNDS